MNIIVGQTRIHAQGRQLPAFASSLSMRLEGRKTWLQHNELLCERSKFNLEVLLEIAPDANVQHQNGVASIFEAHQSHITLPDPKPRFVMEPRKFQLANFERFKNLDQFAIFSEQGTGKTKVAIDIMCHRFLRRTISGVIILSSPKGVHAQWIEEQLPKHLWHMVPVQTYIWGDGKPPSWTESDSDKLQIISGNIDMVRGEKGSKLLKEFSSRHGPRLMWIVDESDSIKDIRAKRSIKLRDLAARTQQRAILTGTPIAKDLTDEWAQFYFLNPDIIGHKYLTSFRAQYCIMGGFEGKAVVGHKNVQRFKEITAPYIFRATKAELDLPPKVYDSVQFELSDKQRAMIKDIREQFFSTVKEGTVSVKNGATAILRIQQITNGFMVDEQGTIVHFDENPRLDALLDLRRQIEGPTIIWCRFKEDVRVLRKHLECVVMWGEENSQTIREQNKKTFISGKVPNLIATPGTMGRGVDGLQDVCNNAIYYSNSYNAIERWQSEDRIHRIGMNETATYFDLIGRGSVDRAILRNLRNKKGLSEWVLDDVKNIIGDAL